MIPTPEEIAAKVLPSSANTTVNQDWAAEKYRPAVADAIRAERERYAALIQAVQDWAADSEGMPDDPSDARLLKALWTHDGDHTKPCDECDGECGEPCAPCTVEQAHASLDRFIADWNKRHSIESVPPAKADDQQDGRKG